MRRWVMRIDPVAGGLQGGVADTVVLERRACAVVSVAVQLDDQAMVEPGSVHLVALHEDVGLGPGQSGFVAEVEEQPLELGAGDRRRSAVVTDGRLQAPEPPVPIAAGDQPLERSQVEYPQSLGFVKRMPRPPPLHDLGQVEEVRGNEVTGMHLPRCSILRDGAGGEGGVRCRDGCAAFGEPSPHRLLGRGCGRMPRKRSCAAVAQQGAAGATCEHGGHPAPVPDSRRCPTA